MQHNEETGGDRMRFLPLHKAITDMEFYLGIIATTIMCAILFWIDPLKKQEE